MLIARITARRLLAITLLPLVAAGVIGLAGPFDSAGPNRQGAAVADFAPAPESVVRLGPPTIAATAGRVVQGDRQDAVALDPRIQHQADLDTDQVSWSPEVIFNDGVESTWFEVRLTSVFKAAFFASDLIRLFDDGTQGDRIAGDGIYSRGGITASGALRHDGGTHQTLRTNRFFTFNDGGVLARSMEVGVSIVDASQRGRVAITDLGGGRFATSHALFIVDDGTIFPGYPAINAKAATDVCLACEALITQFGDIFDFIMLQGVDVLPGDLGNQGTLAFHGPRQNEAEGIGLDVFSQNVGPETFPDGRLRGTTFNNAPSGSPLTHEIMHQFAV